MNRWIQGFSHGTANLDWKSEEGHQTQGHHQYLSLSLFIQSSLMTVMGMQRRKMWSREDWISPSHPQCLSHPSITSSLMAFYPFVSCGRDSLRKTSTVLPSHSFKCQAREKREWHFALLVQQEDQEREGIHALHLFLLPKAVAKWLLFCTTPLSCSVNKCITCSVSRITRKRGVKHRLHLRSTLLKQKDTNYDTLTSREGICSILFTNFFEF